MKFADRAAAGRQLATKLAHLKDRQPVVLALPRGGVAVGFEIALALDTPLDIVLVRKIGVPWQPELALGAVTDGAKTAPQSDTADPPKTPPPAWTLTKFLRIRSKSAESGHSRTLIELRESIP